jgi:regulator of protease activity HflC (stomatin/prohibitin superfamily)
MTLLSFTVPAHMSAVEYRHGVLTRVLEPGRYQRRWGTRRVLVDRRESLLPVSPQEIPTSDGVSVRVSAAVRWAVGDPVAFLERTCDPQGTVYLAAQVALRDGLAALSVEDLISRSTALSAPSITAAVAVVGETVGIEVREVVVKDVIVPSELRAAALELATARSRGAAQLEAARAETAALRSLANGARILDASPALTQLRLVQALPYGAQLVLRIRDGSPGQDAGSVG